MSLDEALETIRSYFFDPNNEHFKQAELALQERMLGRR